MSKQSKKIDERNEACAELRKILKPGQNVYTTVTHVAASGMSRSIRAFVLGYRTDSELIRCAAYPSCDCTHEDDGKRGKCSYRKRRTQTLIGLDWYVSRVVGLKRDEKNGGCKIRGCGMDMGFHLVYLLGGYLWPHDTRKPHGKRNGQPDTSGGYALKQAWL